MFPWERESPKAISHSPILCRRYSTVWHQMITNKLSPSRRPLSRSSVDKEGTGESELTSSPTPPFTQFPFFFPFPFPSFICTEAASAEENKRVEEM